MNRIRGRRLKLWSSGSCRKAAKRSQKITDDPDTPLVWEREVCMKLVLLWIHMERVWVN